VVRAVTGYITYSASDCALPAVLCRCALCFLPQSWLWAVITWANRGEGYGPKAEAVKRIQQA
jgi:hypothetical protein